VERGGPHARVSICGGGGGGVGGGGGDGIFFPWARGCGFNRDSKKFWKAFPRGMPIPLPGWMVFLGGGGGAVSPPRKPGVFLPIHPGPGLRFHQKPQGGGPGEGGGAYLFLGEFNFGELYREKKKT